MDSIRPSYVQLLLWLCLLWMRSANSQELVKSAKIIDNTTNPDTVEITFNVTLPIDEPNANLTGDLTPWLEIQQITTIGSVVTQENNTITINFNTSIPADQVIVTYNVTFRDVELSGTLSWTSTLTYFTDIGGVIYTNRSEATVCFVRESRVVTREENRQWYIAIALLASLVFGILAAIIVLWLIQILCGSSVLGVAAAAKDKNDDKETALPSSNFSSDKTDLAHVICAGDVTEASRLLELCEINDLISAEDHLQWEKGTLLEVLLDSAISDSDKNSRSTDYNPRALRREIQKAIDGNTEEVQTLLKKEKAANDRKLSDTRRNQELEMEKLKTEIASFSEKVQEELIRLAGERHKFEVREVQHVCLLRLKEAERRGSSSHDIKYTVIGEKLDDYFNTQDQRYPSATRDAQGIIEVNGKKLFERKKTRLRTVTSYRNAEVSKAFTHESKIRGKWNRYAQTLVEAVKTICWELQLEPEIRKHITTFIKEKMLEAKKFFDDQLRRERIEFLRSCAAEKSKYRRTDAAQLSSKQISENPIEWTRIQYERIELEMRKHFENEREYDKFVIALWNKKFDAILKQTGEKMKLLKNDVVQQLAQNGASRHSVEDFISRETKDESIDEQAQKDSDFEVGDLGEEDKAKTRRIILHCHDEVLKLFLQSQPFSPDKTSQKLLLNLDHTQKDPLKQSLNRIRDLIQLHSEAVRKKNKGPKNKLRKGLSKVSEDSIRARLEAQLEKWQATEHYSMASTMVSNSAMQEFKNDMLALEENLSSLISNELSNQITKKSKLTLLILDLNALERLMMTLLQSLVVERKLSTAECTVVLQEHKNQTAELKKSSLLRTRRRLEQVVRKRLHSPNPLQFSKSNDAADTAKSQVMHRLNTTQNIAGSAMRKIREDSEALKDKFEVLTQLNEQQAIELRELDLKVIQALSKLANISSIEMNACLTLLLHHRDQDDISNILQVIYSGIKDDVKEQRGLLPTIRDMISQQKHRLAENLLRTDEDFAPEPVRSPNKLQRIKQPHRVTFLDDASSVRRDRLSPLPDIRPEPVGRTSSPDLESLTDYQVHPSTVYSNYDQPLKTTRRKKKKSLKNLSVAR